MLQVQKPVIMLKERLLHLKEMQIKSLVCNENLARKSPSDVVRDTARQKNKANKSNNLLAASLEKGV